VQGADEDAAVVAIAASRRTSQQDGQPSMRVSAHCCQCWAHCVLCQAEEVSAAVEVGCVVVWPYCWAEATPLLKMPCNKALQRTCDKYLISRAQVRQC
jgi:hypothetical protein